MYIFVSGKTGKHLYVSENWRMKGRGENKVIDKVTKKFVWANEIPPNSNRFYLVQFTDIPKAEEFCEVWGKKLKVPIHWQRVAMRPADPWFNEVP